MRKRWNEKGTCYYYFAAFTFIFMLQAFFSLIVNSSALFICWKSQTDLYYPDWIGLAVWIIGFGIETIGDW